MTFLPIPLDNNPPPAPLRVSHIIRTSCNNETCRFRLVTMLMDHNDNLDESTRRRRQTLVDFLRKSCRLGNDFDDEEIHRILGILGVNSFVVHDGGSDEANTDLVTILALLCCHI